MKKNNKISMLCAVIVAMFLLGSCSIEYRSRHHRPYEEQHQENNHHDSYHR